MCACVRVYLREKEMPNASPTDVVRKVSSSLCAYKMRERLKEEEREGERERDGEEGGGKSGCR